MKHRLFQFFAVFCLLIGNGFLYAQSIQSAVINTDHHVVPSVDGGNAYINKHLTMVGGTPYSHSPFRNYGDLTPVVMTFVDDDGTVSVCSPVRNSKDVYIYEYTIDLKHKNTLKLTNELTLFGAFTKDSEGNYYLFSGEDVEEGAFRSKNMALVKYNSRGVKQKVLYFDAQIGDSFSGVKRPFQNGSCRLEVSGNMIAIYFARQMFRARDGLNHQASYGFIVNKNTMESMSNKMPYVSHSFNQFILPINNGFAFADQGDAYPRGFHFSKLQTGQNLRGLTAFKFKQGGMYQNTFSQMGGLAKTSSGFIFAGTYEKNNITSAAHNDSRNMFVLTMNDNLSSCSQPIWITNYTNKDTHNAASPKIAEIGGGQYLLMWELMAKNVYVETFAAVIDGTGKIIKSAESIGKVRLNFNDTLRYNEKDGKVYWAVNNSEREIVIYSYNPGSKGTSSRSSSSSSSSTTSSNASGSSSSSSSGSRSSSETKSSIDVDFGFAGSIGFYLNGLNQNIISIGLPLQLGIEIGFGSMAFALLGEAGIGIGMPSFTQLYSPLLEWNYAGTGELYFPGKKFGLGFSYGIIDSWQLKIGELPLSNEFKTSYMRFSLIIRNKAKTSLNASLYGDTKWGFGLILSKFW